MDDWDDSDSSVDFNIFDDYWSLSPEEELRRKRRRIHTNCGYIIRLLKKDYGTACDLSLADSLQQLPVELRFNILLHLDDFQLQQLELFVRDVIHSDYFIRLRARQIFDRIKEIEAYLKFKRTPAALIPRPETPRPAIPRDDFGTSQNVRLTRNGDFVTPLTFRVELPRIPYAVMRPKWSWQETQPSHELKWSFGGNNDMGVKLHIESGFKKYVAGEAA